MSLLELMPCIFSRGMSLPACQGMVGLFVRSGGFYRRFWVGVGWKCCLPRLSLEPGLMKVEEWGRPSASIASFMAGQLDNGVQEESFYLSRTHWKSLWIVTWVQLQRFFFFFAFWAVPMHCWFSLMMPSKLKWLFSHTRLAPLNPG